MAAAVKKCASCPAVLPVEDFPRDASRPDGRFTMCFPCKRERARASYRRHADRIRTKQAAWRQTLRDQVFARYGESCACCGEDHREFLCIDHIDGGGTQHRREVGKGGIEFYSWLRKNGWPEGYRTLCHNCNQARGAYGFCPHEIEVAAETAAKETSA